MSGGKRASPHVIDGAFSLIKNALTKTVDFPTQINLFHVGKESFVEAPQSMENGGANNQASACCPKYLTSVIVLTSVVFQCGKNSSPTKGIRQQVNKSAAGARIFKLIFILAGQNLGLRGGDRRILKQRNERLQPMRSYLHVGGQQHVIAGIYLLHCFIVPAAKAKVGLIINNFYGREIFTQIRDRIIRGAVVRHKYFSRGGEGTERGEKFFKKLFPVVVENDHLRFGHREKLERSKPGILSSPPVDLRTSSLAISSAASRALLAAATMRS